MDCNVYMLVPADEFDALIRKGKNKSDYKYAFTEMAEDGYLTKETYTYTDNQKYYLFNMEYELSYWDTSWDRAFSIAQLFEQLSKYQILVIRKDGTKYTEEFGFPYSKGFEYPPLRCPIEKSFKYLEKIEEY